MATVIRKPRKTVRIKMPPDIACLLCCLAGHGHGPYPYRAWVRARDAWRIRHQFTWQEYSRVWLRHRCPKHDRNLPTLKGR